MSKLELIDELCRNSKLSKPEARKEYELKKETEFWEIMADHESEKYKRCFEKLNKFEKQLKGGPTFEKAMRKAFDELFLGEG